MCRRTCTLNAQISFKRKAKCNCEKANPRWLCLHRSQLESKKHASQCTLRCDSQRYKTEHRHHCDSLKFQRLQSWQDTKENIRTIKLLLNDHAGDIKRHKLPAAAPNLLVTMGRKTAVHLWLPELRAMQHKTR